MKKTLTALSLALSLSALTAPPALATGIPTVDLAAVAQTITEGLQRAAEAKAALDQAKKQFDEAKKFADDTKKRLEGFTDFKSGFDTAASYMKDGLSDLNDNLDVSSLRSQYPLEEGERQDAILERIKIYDDYNQALTKRAKNLDKLRQQFESAKTPQQKTDLTNQLLFEQITLNTEMKQYEIAQQQLDRKNDAQYEKSRQKFLDDHAWKG